MLTPNAPNTDMTAGSLSVRQSSLDRQEYSEAVCFNCYMTRIDQTRNKRHLYKRRADQRTRKIKRRTTPVPEGPRIQLYLGLQNGFE